MDFLPVNQILRDSWTVVVQQCTKCAATANTTVHCAPCTVHVVTHSVLLRSRRTIPSAGCSAGLCSPPAPAWRNEFASICSNKLTAQRMNQECIECIRCPSTNNQKKHNTHRPKLTVTVTTVTLELRDITISRLLSLLCGGWSVHLLVCFDNKNTTYVEV